MAATKHPRKAKAKADEIGQTWEYSAWRMWCAGNRNCSDIARTLQKAKADGKIPDAPHDHRVVKRAITRESKIAREDLDSRDVDPLCEYIAGLEEDFAEADKLLRGGDNSNARLGGLKLKVDLREKLAAAKGVVTKRQAEEVAGNVYVNINAREELVSRIAGLAARRRAAGAPGEPE